KPNESFVVLGDGMIRVFDLKLRALNSWKAPVSTECAVACSPDGKWIAASAAGSSEIRLWDAVNGTLEQQFVQGGPARDQPFRGNLAFSPDGKLLAHAVQAREIPVWDVKSGKLAHKLGTPKEPAFAMSVGFGGNGKYLVVAGTNKSLQVWGLASGER